MSRATRVTVRSAAARVGARARTHREDGGEERDEDEERHDERARTRAAAVGEGADQLGHSSVAHPHWTSMPVVYMIRKPTSSPTPPARRPGSWPSGRSRAAPRAIWTITCAIAPAPSARNSTDKTGE